MAIALTLQSCTFCFPEAGANAGWGEVTTDWACKITTIVNNIVGNNDILITTACIANSQCTAANVTLLSFSVSATRSFEVAYNVVRGACCNIVEAGRMRGVYDGTNWNLSNSGIAGCAGMAFSITSAGQIQYTSDAQGTGTIKFKASTFDI